jgi:hypothetical protein
MITTSIIVVITLLLAIAAAGLLVIWVDYIDRRWQLGEPNAQSDGDASAALRLWGHRR